MPNDMELTKEQRNVLAEIGRVGGSRKSEKKRRSSRENGKKGGRPLKKSVAVQGEPKD